jgi:hypothetical protein
MATNGYALNRVFHADQINHGALSSFSNCLC